MGSDPGSTALLLSSSLLWEYSLYPKSTRLIKRKSIRIWKSSESKSMKLLKRFKLVADWQEAQKPIRWKNLVYFNLASVCADSRDCRFYFTFFFQFLCGCFLDGCYALKISFFPPSVSPFPPLSPLNLSYLWAVTKNFCVMLFSKVVSMDKSLLFDLLRSMKRSSLSNFCFGFFVQFLYSLSINIGKICLVL